MAAAKMETVIQHIRRAVSRQEVGKTDGQLLASFIEQRDESAFEAILHRHGPMVFGVCRRMIGHHHDSEDAFQATFLVLARKAGSVRPRERLANWLHGVALRTAMKARTMSAKRRGREKQVTEMPEPEANQQDQWREIQPLLDQELNGLPENYRLAILLCDLEGKTIKEATQQLGWRQGTFASRLVRGRKLLAKRLASRGVVLSAGSLAAVVSQNAVSAAVPTPLISSTVKAATVAGVVPATGATLTEGVLKAMMLTKLTNAVAGLVVLSAVVFGGGLFTHCTAAGQQQDGDKPAIGKRDTGIVAEAPKTDLDRLQGVWSVVSAERGGELSKFEKALFMVDGKRACWQTSDSEVQGGLYLDPTSKPKTYDIAMSMRTIEGIYSLDGDTLRICFDSGTEAKRPVSFTTDKGTQQVLIVLKRIHGPEVFPFRLADGTRAFPKITEMNGKTPPPQEAPTPTDNNRYEPGVTAPGKKEPPAPKYQQQDFAVRDTHTDVNEHPTGKPPFGATPQVAPSHPKAGVERCYAVTSRLVEAGSEQPTAVLSPKLTLLDGQPGKVIVDEGPKNLLEKVILDENIKIGTSFDVRVKRLQGNKARLFLSFMKYEIEKANVSEIRVLGNSVQAIQDVELHKAVKIVFQKDAKGAAQRWVEIRVDELTISDEPSSRASPAPAATKE
jgi:RNA polymerase sigma factor (sigma-70 family)